MAEPQRYSWTQPICDDCWDEQRPDRPSPRTGAGEPEICSWCGLETHSGIYLREDPDKVPYPAVLDG